MLRIGYWQLEATRRALERNEVYNRADVSGPALTPGPERWVMTRRVSASKMQPAFRAHIPGAHFGATTTEATVNSTILWIIAAIVVIVGIVQLFQGQIIFGVLLIVLGCLIGPGGVSIFNKRR